MINNIIRDYHSGIGLKKLSMIYHRDWKTIRNILLAAGIKIKIQTKKKINKQEAIKLYKTGISTYKIAKKFNCAPQTVRLCLLRDGTARRGYKEAQCHRYNYNISQLVDINSEIGAYWLGFLLADGHIYPSRYRLRCNLQLRDIGQLFQLAKDLNSNNMPRKVKKTVLGKQYMSCYLVIENKKLIEFYRKIGWCDFKKGKIELFKKFLRHISIRHFLRGLWDGDGIVTHSRKNLRLGICDRHRNIIIFIQELLHQLLRLPINKVTVNRNKKTLRPNNYQAWWVGEEGKDAKNLGRYLYMNCSRHLFRKSQKVLRYLENVT